MSDNKPNEAFQRMAKIQQLNLKIVEARKKGLDREATHLKMQVQELLASAFSTPASQVSPSFVPQASVPSEQSVHSGHEFGVSGQQIMSELHEVNQEIVEARRLGNERQLKRLKERAGKLIKMGSQI